MLPPLAMSPVGSLESFGGLALPPAESLPFVSSHACTSQGSDIDEEKKQEVNAEEHVMRLLDGMERCHRQHQQHRGLGMPYVSRRLERQRHRTAMKMRHMWFESRALQVKEQLLKLQGIGPLDHVDQRVIRSTFRVLDKNQDYAIPKASFISSLHHDMGLLWSDAEMERFWRMLCNGNRASVCFQAFSLVFKADPNRVAENQDLFVELGLRLVQEQAPRTLIDKAPRFVPTTFDTRDSGVVHGDMGCPVAPFGRRHSPSSVQGCKDAQHNPAFGDLDALHRGPAFSFGGRAFQRIDDAFRGPGYLGLNAGLGGPGFIFGPPKKPEVVRSRWPHKLNPLEQNAVSMPFSLRHEDCVDKVVETTSGENLDGSISEKSTACLSDESPCGRSDTATDKSCSSPFFSGKNQLKMQALHDEPSACVIKIQAAYRGHWARRLAHCMRLMRAYESRVSCVGARGAPVPICP